MSAYTITSNKFTSGLPNSVKVGPVIYDVVMQDNLTVENDEGKEVPLFGMVNFKKCQITIDPDLAPVMQWQCFWHELVHIIFEQLGLLQDDMEGQVDAFAYKILEILVDNGFLQFPAQETPKFQGYSPYAISLAHGE